MKELRVLHISSVHPVLDNRIHYKEAKFLKTKFPATAIVTPMETDEVLDGIRYLAISKFKSRLKRFFLAPKEILRKVEAFKPDVIHFHDPELIPLALRLKRRSYKVIYDVHEDLPTQLRYKAWIPAPLRPIASYLVRRLEEYCAKRIDGIVAATEDIAGRFPKEKTICARNLPVQALIKAKKSSNESEKLALIYAGGLARLRGIKESIQAMRGLEDQCELTLIGKWESDEYRKECEALTEYRSVRYLGYLSMEQVYKEISNADIGLAMLYPLKNYLRSLPVKAFEYMAHGIPIIMSDFPYWQEQFQGAAFFAKAKDPKSISSVIRKALESPEKMKALGEHGQSMIKEELNWELESKKLFELYERINS